MGKENLIPVLAITLLLVGICSTLYVHATQINPETDVGSITINGQKYAVEDLFLVVEQKTIIADENEETGIALDEMMYYTNVGCPSCHEYTIKAKDTYQQTVTWDDMQTGILTEQNRVFFPDMAHTFWVCNVIEIEVK